MNGRSALLLTLMVVALVLPCCKKKEAEACSKDDECSEGLLCHKAVCTPKETAEREMRVVELRKEALDGFKELRAKCAEHKKGAEAPTANADGTAALLANRLQLELGAEFEVEVDGIDGNALRRQTETAEKALTDATSIGAGLFKRNAIFKEAVIAALKSLGPDAEMPEFRAVDIIYCAPEMLDATERFLPKE